jgi:hypothetical protein
MSFLNPLFLLGIAALAAPVLVHLVRRTRARKVEFPALIFVRQVPQRTIRRRTLQNLLLLIIRCLAVALIVLAFTRPFFSGSSAAKSGLASRATVVLLDNSLSMRRSDLFSEAQKRATSVIDDASSSDRLALMSFGKTYEVLSRFTSDKNNLRSILTTVKAGWEGTDYEQALRGAESLFRDLQTNGQRQIVLISDFQASGWNQANASFKLSSDIRLVTLDVGGNQPTPNVAVTRVEARPVVFGQKYTENLAVYISNFADTPRDHLVLDFQINDQTVAKRDLNLDSRESKVVEFTDFNLGEGSNRCTIEIHAEDFAPDNRFYFSINRTAQAKALIVESASRGSSDSVYLQSALNMNEDLPFAFVLKTAGTVDPSSLSDYALIILNDAGPLSNSFSEKLAQFVQNGGQLLISAGPKTDAGEFNKSLERLSPAVLRDTVPPRQGESVSISEVKFDHPVFEVFRQGGRLTGAHVFGYFRSEPRATASVLARYEDGSPTLIESSIGKGRVLLFTSSLGASWNDLPLTPLYLPLVHQIVRYLGGRDTNSWYGLGQTFTVGKDSQGPPPPVDAPSGGRVSEERLTPDGDLLVTGREPGFYRLRYNAGPEFTAIDLDSAEGDFTKLDFAQFVAGVTGGGGAPQAFEAGQKQSNEELEGRQKIWWPLLFAALLLLVTESLLSHRTRVAKMVG